MVSALVAVRVFSFCCSIRPNFATFGESYYLRHGDLSLYIWWRSQWKHRSSRNQCGQIRQSWRERSLCRLAALLSLDCVLCGRCDVMLYHWLIPACYFCVRLHAYSLLLEMLCWHERSWEVITWEDCWHEKIADMISRAVAQKHYQEEGEGGKARNAESNVQSGMLRAVPCTCAEVLSKGRIWKQGISPEYNARSGLLHAASRTCTKAPSKRSRKCEVAWSWPRCLIRDTLCSKQVSSTYSLIRDTLCSKHLCNIQCSVRVDLRCEHMCSTYSLIRDASCCRCVCNIKCSIRDASCCEHSCNIRCSVRCSRW